mmetsp:Transcript_12730/g.30193  ORF Transcript_12730/g.30193 Transcript_12730/m.30193 type:complete len:235 (+) Transcript_12730:306-1010(+)
MVIGTCAWCGLPPVVLVMSWMLVRFLSRRLIELSRMKYFCAWLATCVGVLVVTKLREMLRQSPLPNFASPSRNSRCSSSVQGTPFRRSPSPLLPFGLVDSSGLTYAGSGTLPCSIRITSSTSWSYRSFMSSIDLCLSFIFAAILSNLSTASKCSAKRTSNILSSSTLQPVTCHLSELSIMFCFMSDMENSSARFSLKAFKVVAKHRCFVEQTFPASYDRLFLSCNYYLLKPRQK